MSNRYRTPMWRVLFVGMTLIAAAIAPIGATQAQAAEQAAAAQAAGRTQAYDIDAGDLSKSLDQFAEQNGFQIGYPPDLVAGKNAPALRGEFSAQEALSRLLAGTGLTAEFVNDRAIVLRRVQGAGTTAGTTVGQRQPGIEEIIVTGQKREERIQDVPIAISAFSQKDLEAQKLEGGFDLVKAIPNVSFTKTNFTSYNFQIRGVGTQATSATTDPGVAVSFNNTAIIQNRLFEQEYLDVERVEVLRGPQGTLYGRNATAGVINVITNKPELGVWGSSLKLEIGNYNTKRLRGMFNMPIGDTLALRGAYAGTDRDGYTYNSGTGNRVDGRDLWTGRLSLGWQPNDRFRADLIWEHFKEDDNRLRTGKQLCHRDDGPTVIGDTVLTDARPPGLGNAPEELIRGIFSQGCKPGSLYTDSAFETPNGWAINFINATLYLKDVGVPFISSAIGVHPGTNDREAIFQATDPYAGRRQSRDLRNIESIRDPNYRASADLFQLNIDFDVTDTLTFSSQTVYDKDETYSFQDFNRFNTAPIFTDTSQLDPFFGDDFSAIAPGGIFCDPQIGCSDKIAGFDIAQADAKQFNQEFRLQSSFSGPLNFSIGANYTKFKTLVDYYIMYNVLTALAVTRPINQPGGVFLPGTYDPAMPMCGASNYWFNLPVFPTPLPPGYPIPPTDSPAVPASNPNSPCPYVDPNPVDTSKNFEGDGHNYFRSKNPYVLDSWAGFGELYWNIREDLKLTIGLRYTDDTKTFTPIPTQLLLSPSFLASGTVSKGYPENPDIEQHWGEWTGRLVLDWQPILDFTDETLIYGSFSRGYKGGGANPPTPGFATNEQTEEILINQGYGQEHVDTYGEGGVGLYPVLELTGNEYGETFDAEFVNAYEIGTKNTLFGGALMLNATAFYYDYNNYQVSQIRDRTAVNENFDASMWGLEFESVFAPTPNWQFLANVGYLDTSIAQGETSIDIMNRTQNNPDYTLVKPWVQLPSNCVVPTPVVESWLHGSGGGAYFILCGVGGLLGLFDSGIIDPATGEAYNQSNYPELNGGAGLAADVGGNELPNSPHWTVTLGSQYSFDLTSNWRATTRLDYYWQGESYHRVYNTDPYDRLRSWSNTNLSFWVESEKYGLKLEGYVKNLFDNTPITGAFLNSDDTGLTTNVFMFDPRLIGLSVRKDF